MSCSTRSTAIPPAASLTSRSASACDSASSSPEPGSSSSSSLGAMARARASSTIRASPVDMALACCRPSPARPTPSSSRSEVATATDPGPPDSRSPTPASSGRAARRFRGNDRPRRRHSHHLTADSNPTCTFSPAVSEPNSSRRWKVRASPSRARRCGFIVVMSVSNRCTEPRSGDCSPLITLNRVVLPAPLGPIRPVTVPGRTRRLTWVSAATPPKCTPTSETVSTAGAAAPPSAGCTCPTPEDGRTADRGSRLLADLRRTPLDPRKVQLDRLDAQDPACGPPDEDDPDAGEEAQAAGPELIEDHVGEGGEECARHGPDAPYGDEEHEDDAGEDIEVRGAHRLLHRAVQGAGQTGHAGGDGEHGHLGEPDVEADGGIRCRRVVQRDQPAAEEAAPDL